jgi:aconitate hydratase
MPNIYIKDIKISDKEYRIYDLVKAASDVGLSLSRLPYSMRVLFENVVRHSADKKTLSAFKDWLVNKKSEVEIDFNPARVLMQDFTGVPAVVDLAAMRDAMKVLKGDPQKINPLIPVDLVIDHSVNVDFSGNEDSFEKNVDLEFVRNRERYEFLKWGQKSFSNFRVVPPGTGICHQVNLEYLAQTVWLSKDKDGKNALYPDSLVGTDSHTTMINGLSVLGWGVGGIEAEAAMLGQPLPMILPEVVGFRLKGALAGNITATDLVLTITNMLRKKGVVGKFVEFFGPGLDNLSLADRSTIANMAPEYGATCGFFPVDQETLNYLKFSGRDKDRVEIVKQYTQMQKMWRDPQDEPEYTDVLELDMSSLVPSLAGPKRPQDLVPVAKVKTNFTEALPSLSKGDTNLASKYSVSGKEYSIGHGDVVIAAITSCTNTSNPSVMLAAGLLAKAAVEKGLTVKPWVKTSLAPGSQVVTEYLNRGGLDKYLDKLGFYTVGYGCTTCIGNSGPLDQAIDRTIIDNKLTVASVLSGNRNFEGRVHPLVRANYLASPPLVVAYALAGSVNIDLMNEPLGMGNGKPVYLKDIWPTQQEIKFALENFITPEMFKEKYSNVFIGDKNWQAISVVESDTYKWTNSSYINKPPYFENISSDENYVKNVASARILALFDDSITTDHISPAGSIDKNGPAAKFLLSQGVSVEDFNSYGSRRGNHKVMMRGTFANVRIKNAICDGVEGGVTKNHLNNEQMSIYDASVEYKKHNIPLIVCAGKEYGTGSSRDWAAKGTNLLGIKAVIAESFERIHRSNLVGMGVLPITFAEGKGWRALGIDGTETVSIMGIDKGIAPYKKITVMFEKKNGEKISVDGVLQVFTENEVEYLMNGNILASVLKSIRRSN